MGSLFLKHPALNFSETILQKQKSILPGILRHVYKIYFSQKSKMCQFCKLFWTPVFKLVQWIPMIVKFFIFANTSDFFIIKPHLSGTFLNFVKNVFYARLRIPSGILFCFCEMSLEKFH